MARLGPLLSQANREDDATRLLRALRPLLGEARQKKVDEAIQILQMLRLLPPAQGEPASFPGCCPACCRKGAWLCPTR